MAGGIGEDGLCLEEERSGQERGYEDDPTAGTLDYYPR
jgi:hypothetical protein